ncbi:MAG: biotin--[acetyl-CoA-carboxylase] ligase [Melioribacteraceae bacterium]|nr:biotin--[acetyl-CoA-carboxylase] ligase [Melioribacteraceae bacterium]
MAKILFNIEEFDIKLDTEFIGRNFIYYDEVDSTNSELLKDDQIKLHGSVMFAEYQLKGRGRRDRNWISEKEQALTFSILLTEKNSSKNINFVNLAASLAVAQSIENLYQLDIQLKWPNDIMIGNNKVAGILIESTSTKDKIDRVVVGIGVNVNQSSFAGKFIIPPTSIRKEFHKTVKRERLMSEILNEFEEIFNKIKNDREKILDNWRARCKWIGEKIKIVDGESEVFGLFEDINENGYLILKTRDDKRTIYSGDVSIRK